MYLGVCVLYILSVSASMMQYPSSSKVHIMRPQYRRSNVCSLCYGTECLTFDQDRCDYYAEVNDLLLEENAEPGIQDLELKNNVDTLIFDIVEKALQSDQMDCIPFLSSYTDCNKENLCIGCSSCHCDAEGKWNCTSTSYCRLREPFIDVNHRVLVRVIENLNISGVKTNRQKRSMNNGNILDNANSSSTPEDVVDWFYRIESLQKEKPMERTVEESPAARHLLDNGDIYTDSTNANAAVCFTEHNSVAMTTESTTTTEVDYLAFDEMLNNIAIDTKNYTRRKPALFVDNETIDFDYILSESESKSESTNNSDDTTEAYSIDRFITTENGVTEQCLDNGTEVIIDLLESVKNNVFNQTDLSDVIENTDDVNGFDNTNNIVKNSAINLFKRDASDALKTTNAPNITNTTQVNTRNFTAGNTTINLNNQTNLKKNVLLPLIKIINSKHREMDKLENIKKYLIIYMKSNNLSPVVEILDYPNISETNSLHDFEMFPELAFDYRRKNFYPPHIFLRKLKADIQELIEDILYVQRQKHRKIPDDLAVLVEVLREYMHNTKTPLITNLKDKADKDFDTLTRRHWEQNHNKCMDITYKECIVKVFNVIDKNMPESNAVSPLSMASRKILNNVVKTYYEDDFSTMGQKAHGLNNITNDIKASRFRWQHMTNNIVGNSPSSTLYKMKLLLLFLEIDIHTLTNELELMNFAQNRRMIPYLKNIENNFIDDVNDGLKTIFNNMQPIVQFYSKNAQRSKDVLNFSSQLGKDIRTTVSIRLTKEEHIHDKHSFIKRIRNLLKSSKRDKVESHQKVPKFELVKRLALKKLSDIARKRYIEYEETMKIWQKNLQIVPRHKRYVIEQLRGRIKNIIPKYLRHKVNPKIRKKKEKTINSANKYRKDHNKGKKTTLTTATTPKTKPTTRKSKTKSHKIRGIADKIKNAAFVFKRIAKIGVQ